MAAILAERMRSSLVSADVRARLLDVAALLSAEADGNGSQAIRACASELRAICGLTASSEPAAAHESGRAVARRLSQ